MNWRTETNSVFVDVDGTLLIWPTKAGAPRPGETPKVNQALVDALKRWRHATAGTIVVWTRGGKAHAEMAARVCGLEGVLCIGKPDCYIDDASPEKLWRKIAYRSPADFVAEVP